MPLMFEQLPNETAEAYAAFKAYLDMGASRSLAAVAAKLKRSTTFIARWSGKHRWRARIAAAHSLSPNLVTPESLKADGGECWDEGAISESCAICAGISAGSSR